MVLKALTCGGDTHLRPRHPPQVPADWESRLGLMTGYLRDPKFKRYNEVPDPYYVSLAWSSAASALM